MAIISPPSCVMERFLEGTISRGQNHSPYLINNHLEPSDLLAWPDFSSGEIYTVLCRRQGAESAKDEEMIK